MVGQNGQTRRKFKLKSRKSVQNYLNQEITKRLCKFDVTSKLTLSFETNLRNRIKKVWTLHAPTQGLKMTENLIFGVEISK